MASLCDTSNTFLKKRSRQDSSDPETNCQKCDKIIKEKIMCQGCKLDYCINCVGIIPTLFECLIQGEMEDFFWSFRVVLGWAYRGLTGGFLLLQNFSVAISVSPHFCFILVLILISMFLR